MNNNKQSPVYKVLLIAAAVSGVTALVGWLFEVQPIIGPALFLFFLLLALGVRGYDFFKSFSYTIMIFAAVTVSMFYPSYFREIGGYDLSNLIVPLLQIIMFGMGTAMSFKDFAGVIKMPKGVLVGVLCQFTIMPVIGFTIAEMFGFPPEIAAGVILVGSSPSGLASNVMSFIAKANLALSVTLTAVATLLSPLITPVLMKYLAGTRVDIDVIGMMWSIVKIVIIPIAAGLIFNRLFHGKAKWLDAAMPVVSMAGIGIIITIITAAGRDSLLTIGFALILASLIHNLSGYFLGYWFCRLIGMDERSCRTISLEVGMQNGGLASGIAKEMGRLATVGLAPAVFGPMMNITGSSLATYWRGKPADKGIDEKEEIKKEIPS